MVNTLLLRLTETLLFAVAAGGFLGDTANTVEASTTIPYLGSFTLFIIIY
jgi:hypothetical protein